MSTTDPYTFLFDNFVENMYSTFLGNHIPYYTENINTEREHLNMHRGSYLLWSPPRCWPGTCWCWNHFRFRLHGDGMEFEAPTVHFQIADCWSWENRHHQVAPRAIGPISKSWRDTLTTNCVIEKCFWNETRSPPNFKCVSKTRVQWWRVNTLYNCLEIHPK